MRMGFFGDRDDENVLRLVMVAQFMDILKTTELYTLNGLICIYMSHISIKQLTKNNANNFFSSKITENCYLCLFSLMQVGLNWLSTRNVSNSLVN